MILDETEDLVSRQAGEPQSLHGFFCSPAGIDFMVIEVNASILLS